MNQVNIDFFSILPDRVIIEVSGSDRCSFLQGLVTQDVSLIEKELIIYTLMLSPQGKFQYDFFIINTGDLWLIDIDSIRADSLIQRLQLFKLHANVSIVKNTNMHVAVSSEIVHAGHCFRDPRLKILGYRCYGNNFENKQTPTEVYENLRLSQGIPDGVRDMVIDKSIPLEWGMDELHAISWDKGCYMGQELTARSRYVGQIRKHAFPIELQSTDGLEIGTKLQINQEEVGELRTFNDKFGIALLRIEALTQENSLTIANDPVKVRQPCWMKVLK